ncbi:MAG: hypothetical protein AAFU55_05385 [Pseudomonadota bacterium]
MAIIEAFSRVAKEESADRTAGRRDLQTALNNALRAILSCSIPVAMSTR